MRSHTHQAHGVSCYTLSKATPAAPFTPPLLYALTTVFGLVLAHLCSFRPEKRRNGGSGDHHKAAQRRRGRSAMGMSMPLRSASLASVTCRPPAGAAQCEPAAIHDAINKQHNATHH
jgi:hypothetical protein